MPYTLVPFHAHPDDEAIATGGTMARAKAEGHRVVLVVATRGELGETRPTRSRPARRSPTGGSPSCTPRPTILGVDRVEFLGYRDSGMAGEPTNDDAGCVRERRRRRGRGPARRDPRRGGRRRAHVYDEHGDYGHPDHIQVHRVGVRAAELAGTPRVYEATMNRDYIRRLHASRRRRDARRRRRARPRGHGRLRRRPRRSITTTVDVRDFVDRKRAAMVAHASQIPADSFFLQLPPEAFREAFGYEWFIRARPTATATRETWLFDDLAVSAAVLETPAAFTARRARRGRRRRGRRRRAPARGTRGTRSRRGRGSRSR